MGQQVIVVKETKGMSSMFRSFPPFVVVLAVTGQDVDNERLNAIEDLFNPYY